AGAPRTVAAARHPPRRTAASLPPGPRTVALGARPDNVRVLHASPVAPPETVTLRPDTVCVTSSPSNRATADPPRTLMTPVVPPVSVKVMVRSGVPSPTATSTGPTANITDRQSVV